MLEMSVFGTMASPALGGDGAVPAVSHDWSSRTYDTDGTLNMKEAALKKKDVEEDLCAFAG